MQDKLHQIPSTHTKLSPLGSSSLTAKAQVTTTAKKMITTKSSFDSDSIVRAAAVAAGARIASPADAASLLKAAQSKNAIHIMAKIPASTKAPTPGRGPNHLEAHPSIKATTLSNIPVVMSSVSRGGPVKITSPKTATLSSVPTDQNTNTVVASVAAAADPSSEKETKTVEEIRGRGLGGVQATSQKDEKCLSRQSISERVSEEKPAVLEPALKRQATETSNCSSSQKTSTAPSDIKVEVGNQAEERRNSNTSTVPSSSDQQGIINQSQVESSKPQDMDIDGDGKDKDITKTDGCSENSGHKEEPASEILEGNTKVKS